MRGSLKFMFWCGWVGIAIGVLMTLALLPDMSKVPAIVIMPQIINATLVGGFGTLAMVVSAAGLTLVEGQDRQQEALGLLAASLRTLNATASVQTSAPTVDHGPPRTAATDPNGECPNCGRTNVLAGGKCTHCGWDPLARRPAGPLMRDRG